MKININTKKTPQYVTWPLLAIVGIALIFIGYNLFRILCF